MSPSIRSANGTSSAPARVSRTSPWSRSNSVTPSCRSSARICLERAGWLMYSVSAARVKCSCVATARKYRTSRRCTSIASGYTKRSWTREGARRTIGAIPCARSSTIPTPPHGLRLGEAPDPDPRPSEALIEVAATSLNFADVAFLRRRFGPGDVPGFDAAGTVRAAAEDGSGPPPGTRVATFGSSGGWAERRAVDTAELAVVPDAVDFGAAAALPAAGVTALRALRRLAPVAGRRVLITGASGGVGRFAVQLAADAGAHVVAVGRESGRGRGPGRSSARPRWSSASTTWPSRSTPRSTTSAARCSPTCTRCSARAALVLSIGMASLEPTTIDFEAARLRAGGTRIEAFVVGGRIGDDLAHLVALLAAGRLDPQIGWRGPWDRAGEAADALLGRRVRGKAVLEVARDARGPAGRGRRRHERHGPGHGPRRGRAGRRGRGRGAPAGGRPRADRGRRPGAGRRDRRGLGPRALRRQSAGSTTCSSPPRPGRRARSSSRTLRRRGPSSTASSSAPGRAPATPRRTCRPDGSITFVTGVAVGPPAAPRRDGHGRVRRRRGAVARAGARARAAAREHDPPRLHRQRDVVAPVDAGRATTCAGASRTALPVGPHGHARGHRARRRVPDDEPPDHGRRARGQRRRDASSTRWS